MTDATARAIVAILRSIDRQEARIAALEAEVARLSGLHPAPAAAAEPAAKPGPAPVAVKAPSILDVVRAHPQGISAALAVHEAYSDGVYPAGLESILRDLQARGLIRAVRDTIKAETILYPTEAPDLSGLAAWSSR